MLLLYHVNELRAGLEYGLCEADGEFSLASEISRLQLLIHSEFSISFFAFSKLT